MSSLCFVERSAPVVGLTDTFKFILFLFGLNWSICFHLFLGNLFFYSFFLKEKKRHRKETYPWKKEQLVLRKINFENVANGLNSNQQI